MRALVPAAAHLTCDISVTLPPRRGLGRQLQTVLQTVKSELNGVSACSHVPSSPQISVHYREVHGGWSDPRPFGEGLDIFVLSQIPLDLTLFILWVSEPHYM